MKMTEKKPVEVFGEPNSLPNLKISTYDRAANWLIALLMVLGFTTGCIALLWIGGRLRYEHPMKKGKWVVINDEGYGRGQHDSGFATDAQGPGDPDLPKVEKPEGSELSQVVESDPNAALAVVAEAAEEVAVEVGDIVGDTVATSHRRMGFRDGVIGGGDVGRGDGRQPGPLGDGANSIPRWMRWEFQFTSNSISDYAQQLDYFQIELGVIGGGRKVIDYAFHLAKTPPDVRTGLSKAEKRLYMTWKGGTLKEFDHQLLNRAGISTEGRIHVMFFSDELEKKLVSLEAAEARGRSPSEFLKTVFAVRSVATGYEFFVADQRFRPAPTARR